MFGLPLSLKWKWVLILSLLCLKRNRAYYAMKLLSQEVVFYLCKSDIQLWMEYYCTGLILLISS